MKGKNRSVIIIPENTFNEGWGSLALEVENFILRSAGTQGAFITSEEANSKTITGKGKYIEALHNSKWNQKELVVVKEASMLKTSSAIDHSLLRRCLMGRFFGGEDAPIHNDVR